MVVGAPLVLRFRSRHIRTQGRLVSYASKETMEPGGLLFAGSLVVGFSEGFPEMKLKAARPGETSLGVSLTYSTGEAAPEEGPKTEELNFKIHIDAGNSATNEDTPNDSEHEGTFAA